MTTPDPDLELFHPDMDDALVLVGALGEGFLRLQDRDSKVTEDVGGILFELVDRRKLPLAPERRAVLIPMDAFDDLVRRFERIRGMQREWHNRGN